MINQHELQMGIKDEMEHTGDARLAEKIAMDHLRSDPKYYTKLHNAGLEQEGAMTNQERGMEECGVADVAIIKIAAVGGTKASGGSQTPLTSSGLGNKQFGTPKPLKSDNLGSQAPKGDNSVGTLGKTPPKMASGNPPGSDDKLGNQRPNNVSYDKTPSLPGSNSNSDASDYFGSKISKALEDEVPRRAEMIPPSVS